MTALLKATLRELPASDDKPAVDVQFNPSTLRVQITNRSSGGEAPGSQARQRPGSGATTVSFDLVFDTADEGTTSAPVPVTRKTMEVEKFVRPRGTGRAEESPPRLEFRWGSFVIEGVMESANIDLDHFAADGTPLRAKVAVSIKGQYPEYRYAPSTAASDGAGPPPAPGGAGNGRDAPPAGAPGTAAAPGVPRKVTQAMPGESLQQLAARAGLDPAAWRALAAGVANPLALAAGTEVALPAGLSQGPGLTGRQGGGADPARAAAALPLVDRAKLPGAAPGAPRAGAAPDPVRQGQALARQGGLQGSIDQLRGAAQRSAVAGSQAAFGLDELAARSASSASAPERPYGAGAPLRPLLGDTGPAPSSLDPTVPGWQALRQRGASPVRAPGRLRPRGCGCDCPGPARRR
jgi:LysM repeat protein